MGGGRGGPPDGAIGIDLCHHLLPPGDGAVVPHLPEGVVLDGLALLELRARAALVELVALWGGGALSQRDPHPGTAWRRPPSTRLPDQH